MNTQRYNTDQMNKIFHTKITGSILFLLVGEIALFGFFLWNRLPIPSLLILMLAIMTMEYMLHSTYTVTSDGRLILYRGRFLRTHTFKLDEIDRLESNYYSFRIFVRWGRYVLLVLKDGRQLGIRPDHESDFIHYIEYKKTQLAHQVREDEEI